MKNRNILFYALSFLLAFSSCKKEAALDDDFSAYNPDGFIATDLDRWLEKTLVDEYNIEVIYRYNRYMTDVAKDVAPPRANQVQPQMEAVINGFLEPYKKVAGASFIKRNTPKQFVLFGSGAYQDDGTIILGTADAGRRIVLYRVNDFSTTNATAVKRNLRTIHHEFTHILNQLVRIPSDFEQLNKADYLISWDKNSAAEALSLGFISQYSRSAPGEDFAEMVAHLLVEGQLWFDNRVRTSTEVGKQKLREKEQIIVDYFSTNLAIDFRELQREVQSVVTDTYNSKDNTFANWLNQGLFQNLTYSKVAAHYIKYGTSSEFNEVFEGFENEMFTTHARLIDDVIFNFDSPTVLTVRFNYHRAGAAQFSADNSFTYSVNPTTSEVTFTKVAQAGTGGAWGNAAPFEVTFANTLSKYLTSNIFIADWLPKGVEKADYQRFGGFYVKGNSSNYFYGPLVRNK